MNEYLNLIIDPQKNTKNELIVSKSHVLPKIFIIPANEELQIARETAAILSK